MRWEGDGLGRFLGWKVVGWVWGKMKIVRCICCVLSGVIEK